jgi:plasmid stability protein
MPSAPRTTALTIRQLPLATARRLRTRAEEHHRSLEAEVRDILIREAAQPSMAEWLRRAQELAATTTPWEPGMPTAVDLVREIRDEER